MKILADLHHGDLFYSLQLLFEKRLGHELYRPIGMEWYYENYWNVYPHIDTARQFLDTDTNRVPLDVHGRPLDRRSWINRSYTIKEGIYYIKDPTKDKINRGITLDLFKNMEFDIILSSIPAHIHPFEKLRSEFQPQAKHIFQIGNSWSLQQDVNNIMASCGVPPHIPADKNIIFYHQEFDLDVFAYKGIDNVITKSIASFIHYMPSKNRLIDLGHTLGDWSVSMYGAGMPNDSICMSKDIADTMRRAGFIWHVKPGGDGFGHIIHNAFAVGRPVITAISDYRGKLAESLLVKDKTYFEVTDPDLPSKLQQIAGSISAYEEVCHNCYEQFRKVVDFDEEEIGLRHFLSKLQ